MAAKSVVEIDVQDEKFQAFLEKFNEYQKALEELPEQWRGAAQGSVIQPSRRKRCWAARRR